MRSAAAPTPPRRGAPGRGEGEGRTFVLAASLLAAACAPSPASPTCELPFTETGTVRVLAVGHRVTLDDATSYAAFEASYRRHLPALRACLAADRPNLLLFPEDAGLVAWFIGRQGLAGRHAGDIGTAFNLLYGGAMPAADAYRARFPGISEARGLTLALSDRAWRAMDATFGGLAKDTGAWVVTSANLPVSRESFDGDDQLFRDPDGALPAYVATGPELFNAGLVYGPKGMRVARVNKAYLTDPEEQTLDMSTASLADLGVVALPFGRVGIAISRDAFYPPFQQRLEDLGAELVAQPEAFTGWTVEQEPGDWLPEVILASSWSSNQKYAGFRHSAMPVLTGNVLSAVFDGQPWITSQAVPGGPRAALVGLTPTPGLDQVGRWAFEEDLTGTLDERRARLRELGKRLLPGSGAKEQGKTADSLVGADLSLTGDGPGPVKPVTTTALAPSAEVAPTAKGHQANPVAAWDAVGRVYAAWTDGRQGEERTYVARSDDGGATWGAARAVAAGGRQLRPALAAAGDGRVVVAWQELRGGVEQIRVARSNDAAATFGAYWLDDTGAAQWEPAVALFADGQHVIAWTDFRRGLAPEVRVRCWGLTAVPPSRAVDESTAALARAQPSQLQPALVGSAVDRLTLAWIDYRDRDWQVRAASGDLCGGAVESVQVSPSSDSEVLAADPQLSAAPDGTVALAWDEIRDRRGRIEVRAATRAAGAWTVAPALSRVEHGRFRPSPFFLGGWRAILQDQAPGKNGLAVMGFDGAAPVRFDDTGVSTNQLWRPRAAVSADGLRGVVLFVDDRGGLRRVRASAL